MLKPVHYSAVFSRELEASYCPASLTDPSITPRFNKDKRHFTTSFLLPVDQVKVDLTQEKLELNAEFYRTEHDKYKLENTMEKSTVVRNQLTLVVSQAQIQIQLLQRLQS